MRVTKEKKSSSTIDQRIAVTFQCEKALWMELDEFMTERYGNYKKSMLIESLIRIYLRQKKNIIYPPPPPPPQPTEDNTS